MPPDVYRDTSYEGKSSHVYRNKNYDMMPPDVYRDTSYKVKSSDVYRDINYEIMPPVVYRDTSYDVKYSDIGKIMKLPPLTPIKKQTKKSSLLMSIEISTMKSSPPNVYRDTR